ncbi:aminotransferase class I/II-fold pyridoxal phosphate-dependent enzyme [Microbacterium sp. W1N]|uniref:MalY/PatB family protein n=1 Tax=Microbacterium festucae TaxID=2977531 RepID=UPI0021C19466|nr:aminotransferase class I/II-fold pyridoxal phosphate-dependent enzyme [Microbacterium festucae]MCT9819979.1 aminotransferase class I/II-fold pyridoxal phosphate-dependent enzyme [Microbacterium festucae]
MSVTPLEALPLETLRRRSSTKWRTHPHDVLPMFVAETDFPLAEPIREALAEAVAIGDTGYTPPDPGLRDVFAAFAARRYGWEVDPARVDWTGDVMMAVVEVLRGVIAPGDEVVVTPPVYPPFFFCVEEAGGVPRSVPLAATGAGWSLDLAGIEAALAAGARAVLLCNPHNPTGTVHSRETLARLAAIARRYGAVVVSDEIHAPLAQPGTGFTPFLAAGEDAAEVGYAITSSSKAFNLAGLKCALIVTAAAHTTRVVRGLPREVEWRTGLLGAIATRAAFAPASDAWLDALLARLDENRHLLAALLTEHLPEARFVVPDAGFLGWIDLSAYGWGDDPAEAVLHGARVALQRGPDFGAGGLGHARINFGCGPDVLREAVARIGALARA